jgi:hypothetical protein
MAEATQKPKSNPPAAKSTAGTVKSKGKATAAAPEGERCSVDKCTQPVRAKGLCRKHYIGWRRGDVGKKHRYNTCSKEGCRKKAVSAGRCEEHKKGAAEGAAAAG